VSLPDPPGARRPAGLVGGGGGRADPSVRASHV
jgi:hypothetical protein